MAPKKKSSTAKGKEVELNSQKQPMSDKSMAEAMTLSYKKRKGYEESPLKTRPPPSNNKKKKLMTEDSITEEDEEFGEKCERKVWGESVQERGFSCERNIRSSDFNADDKIMTQKVGPLKAVTVTRSQSMARLSGASSSTQPDSSPLKKLERDIKVWFKTILGNQRKIEYRLDMVARNLRAWQESNDELPVYPPELEEGLSEELDRYCDDSEAEVSDGGDGSSEYASDSGEDD